MREIEFSDEESLLALSANDLLGKSWDFAAVRRALASESGYDAALYRRMAELGWLGVALPSEYGGAGMTVGALTSVCEAMGRSLLASPFLASTLAGQALLRAGTPQQKQRWLPEIASGSALATLALSEPNGSFEWQAPVAIARATSQGFTLSGHKTGVLDAQHARCVIVSARLNGAPALFLVEAGELAGRMHPEILVDQTRRSARLDLEGLSLGRSALLDGGDAGAALGRVLCAGYLLVAAEMAGGAEGVLQLTLDYLRTRKQFGKPIGSYQALKHPMVDIMIAIEQGRSLLYHAATVFERDPRTRELAARMAKAQLGETYTYAADRAVQFHGAIGFTYECHAQLFLRRAQWTQYVFGDSLHHRRHIADLMWPRAVS
jgi:alkylation response protein AidB-like acyl-CoA dehydrogenase